MQDLHERAAANDTTYLPARHRTLPIPESVTPIANYPTKLRIFKTRASRYWQVRCYLRGKTYTQSLKTTNKAAAISQAKQFFHIKTAELYGEHIVVKEDRPVVFNDLVTATLAQQQARVERGELTAPTLATMRNRLAKNIQPCFGTMPIDSIKYQDLTDFVQRLSQAGLSSTSIQQHIVVARKVFNYAHSMNLIKSMPHFPNVKVKIQPRGSFTVAEYRSLVIWAQRLKGTRIPTSVTSKSRRGELNVEQYARISQDLAWLIRFIVNGFMRPSDIKFLQHQHVTVVRAKHIYLRLNLPETKNHDKPIVTLQAAVYVYERLLAWQQSQGYGKPTDYVFLPEQQNRKLVLETYRWQFTWIQQQAGIGMAGRGQVMRASSRIHIER